MLVFLTVSIPFSLIFSPGARNLGIFCGFLFFGFCFAFFFFRFLFVFVQAQ